ncbi:hypothetical protein TURU_000391 [Turdus rufiventris]|nr:hypothetical protein TURU_000391 [Turdus rufiventris]
MRSVQVKFSGDFWNIVEPGISSESPGLTPEQKGKRKGTRKKERKRKSIATPETLFLINPGTAGYPLSITLGHRKAVLESKVLTKE